MKGTERSDILETTVIGFKNHIIISAIGLYQILIVRLYVYVYGIYYDIDS